MKNCYFQNKPTGLELEYAKEKIKKELEKAEKDARFYERDSHDPLSKFYLPKLHEKESDE
jgi:hypothetical protein